ncbi:recombinase family protein [Corynebacterium sp. HMSC072A04]|uniref:recombinase family protein n=1 Tax=Corynebacterium sp. HMSC072A04 TaxID=1715045 RepID=UPI0008ABFCDD|nr:recombinase family protein [Corynebacterium sp. HMSC072A04]OFN33382.1 hypothetical protein HMPREF2565_12990 [Corynebacterium sp. HMSC072A04]
MTEKPLKALVVIRLSRLVEESSSPERQEAECRDLCKRMGWEVAGVASDLNVSAGATTPFERPELGKWLGSGALEDPGRSHEFDVIVFWRLDRLVRSMTQLSSLMTWCERHEVYLKSATENHIDTTTDMGRIMAMLVGSFAEVELAAIRERTGADQHHRIVSGKYRGAVPSWGYRPVKDPDKGWILELDPVQVAQVNKAAGWILQGVSMNETARRFNEAGELTPRDLHDKRMNREPRNRAWSGNRMKEMLVSKAMLGYAMIREPVLDKNGKPRRDSRGQKVYEPEARVAIKDGAPVRRAEPVLDRDTWERVCKELESREITVSARSHSLLLNVLFCGVCGRKTYKLTPNNGRKPTYRCSSAAKSGTPRCCDKTLQVDEEWVENAVTDSFLELLGDSVRAVRVWDDGVDNSSEVAELSDGIEELASELSRYRAGSTAFTAIADNIDKMQQRLDELEAEEARAPGWVWEPTGQSIRDWWENASVVERNAYLVECGVRVEFEHEENRKRGQHPRLSIVFENLPGVIEELSPGAAATRAMELLGTVQAGHSLVIQGEKTRIQPR